MIDNSVAVLALLKLLTPYDISPYQKIRVGSQIGDGGYILLDKLHSDQIVYSFGIGYNPSFDEDMAKRGHKIFMFDHTIKELHTKHPNFNYFKEGIAAEDKPEESLYSFAHYLKRFNHTDRNMILKMDVEGAEWPALAAIPVDNLLQFEQLTFEFHGFHNLDHMPYRMAIMEVLAKLAKYYTLFHVHANNSVEPVCKSGFVVCPAIEVSYVRNDIVTRLPSRTLYPTPLDTPCSPGSPDIFLSFFPFSPLIAEPEVMRAKVEDTMTRINYQVHLYQTRKYLTDAHGKIAELQKQ